MASVPTSAGDLSEVDLGDPNISLPDRLGPFIIHRRLGRGGMGVVLDATTAGGVRVALKLIRPAGDADRKQMLHSRLLREARVLQQLNHPGVVGFVDFGVLDGLVYLAMNYVEGVTLEDIRRRTSLGLDGLLPLGTQISHALAHMHEVGVVHRDIKPSNVIIDANGRAILADFGIARYQEATGITKVGEVVGSAGYLAPECFKGDEPSPLTDQFALGKLLFEMCALSPPKQTSLDAPVLLQFMLKMEVEWDRFPKDPPWPGLGSVIRRMVSIDPKDRFPTSMACHDAIAEFDRVRKMHAAPPPPTGSIDSRNDTTVFAQENTLNAFVGRLNLKPRAPWADPEVQWVQLPQAPPPPPPPSLSLRLTPESQPEPPRPEARSVEAPPATPRSAVALYLFAGVVLGVVLAFFVPRGDVSAPLELRSRYKGEEKPSAERVLAARAMLTAAHASLREQNVGEAENLLVKCVELADLPDCHRSLATLLSITGEPAANAQFLRYVELSTAADREPLRRLLSGNE